MKANLKYTRWLLVLILVSANINAAPVQWVLNDKSATQAIELLNQQTDKPSEMTQLLRKITFTINSDTVTMHKTVINYFPRFIDAQDYGSPSIYYDPNFEQVRILTAIAVDKNGVVSQANSAHSKILNTDDYNTFSSTKELMIPFQGLSEGSLTKLEYEIVTERKKMETVWSQELITSSDYPIKHYQLNVTWPKDQSLAWKTQQANVTCQTTETSLECQGEDMPVYQGDEHGLWRDHIGRIWLGGMSNWNQIIDRVSKAMQSAVSSDDDKGLDTLIKTLTKDSTTQEQRIGQIFQFVARDIRYLSRSEYGHAITPHNVLETVNNRFGDCKDKSILLKTLLEKIGIPTQLVLVSTNRNDPKTLLLPSMDAFNHVITCFDLNNRQYCLDPTDTQTDWTSTPAWIQGNVILPLEADYIPHTLERSRYLWHLNVWTKLTFDYSGGTTEKLQRTYYSQYASRMREWLYSNNQTQRVENLVKQYNSVVANKVTPSFEFEKFEDMTKTLVINSDVYYSPTLKIYQPLKFEEPDSWLRDELTSFELTNKRFDQYFTGLDVTSEYLVDAEDIWTISELPAELDFRDARGSMRRTVKRISPSQFKVKTRVKMPAQKLRPDELEKYKQLLDIFYQQAVLEFSGPNNFDNDN